MVIEIIHRVITMILMLGQYLISMAEEISIHHSNGMQAASMVLIMITDIEPTQYSNSITRIGIGK